MRKLLLPAISLALFAIFYPAAAAPSDPMWGEQWGLQKVGAEAAWAKGRGAGITIAVIDSGIDATHPDLSGKLILGHDYYDGDENPRDNNGHGTHVAGIAAAKTFNGIGVAGMAPDAKILVLRVLGGWPIATNLGTNPMEGIFASSAQATIDAADRGADVINLSLGPAVPGQEVNQDFVSAIEYAWGKGAIVVVAAGNDDGQSPGYTNEPALIVAATERNDTRADYSNIVGTAQWGLAAPGGGDAGGIKSTSCCHPTNPQAYEYKSGTSMSAPHVSGAAAVLRSMGVNPEDTVNLLLKTAVDLGPQGRDTEFGYGRLNLAAAVEAAKSASAGGGSTGPGSSPRSRRAGTTPATQGSLPSPSPIQNSPEPSPTGSENPDGGAEVAGKPSSAPPKGSVLIVAFLMATGAGAGVAWWYGKRAHS